MMTASFAIAAAVAWAVACYKLRDLRRDPHNPTLRAFWITILLIALEVTVRIPPVLRTIENATGVVAIWATCLTILVCAALQTTVLLWTHSPQQARSKIRVRLPLYGVAAMVMVALVLQAPPIDPARVDDLAAFAETIEMRYGHTPYVAESIIIYLVMVGYTVIDSAGHFRRYARLVDRRWLRRGLRVMVVGAMLTTVCCLASIAYVVASRLDIAVLNGAQRIVSLFGSGVAISVFFAGATMPAWGPKLHRMRAYRQLRPLWRALCQATPEVVLDAPSLRRLDGWRIPDLDFRLYRRIIEIRDSRLALRPYLDQDVAAAARRLAQEAGLDGNALQAAVEASVLAGAIRAKAGGRPAKAHPMDDTRGGVDLAGELAWLTEVAKAFTGSPIVAAAVAADANDSAGQHNSARKTHADAPLDNPTWPGRPTAVGE